VSVTLTASGKEGDNFQTEDDHITTPYSHLTGAQGSDDVGTPLMHQPKNASTGPNVVHERDGGSLIQEDDIVLPPVYDPLWSAGSSPGGVMGLESSNTGPSPTSDSSNEASPYPREKKRRPRIQTKG
jgi:hypothetical protein